MSGAYIVFQIFQDCAAAKFKMALLPQKGWVCTKTQNDETKPPKRNSQNKQNETQSPKQGKPLLSLRANHKQANLGIFQSNLKDIQANRSTINTL